MASQEYLTANSLTSYPFKTRRPTSLVGHPIEDDWFYDIQFTSFVPGIRQVYVASIEKTLSGELIVSFGNAETDEIIPQPVEIASVELVNHYRNSVKSFASSTGARFAVKLIFGPGLLEKTAFNQTYTKAEAELTSAAVVLSAPRVNSLSFKAYDGGELLHVASYMFPEVPYVQPRYNSTFTLYSIHSGDLSVDADSGAGLYDACPAPGAITDVYTINTITPNDTGALFINTSPCYTLNTLTSNDEILLGEYLTPYRDFTIHTGPTTTDTFDAVDAEHSLVLQNFCKPKCPPENLAAFAYYLNRVTDGAAELTKIATSNVETRGRGRSNVQIFTADAFCVNGDDTFVRCSDPAITESYISCGAKFIKYFHEARTLQISYDNVTVRNYTIVEVLDDNSVRLSSSPTQSGNALSFRVIDNGVISNMNCAAAGYNSDAQTYLQPYFKVKHTTSEAFNSAGEYVTYLAVSVVLFNPSKQTAQLQVFTDSGVSPLTRQGNFKIRTSQTVTSSTSGIVSIGCRDYAFVEVVYYIPCGVSGGSLAVNVFDITSSTHTQVGSSYSLNNIAGAPCLGTTLGETTLLRVTQPNSGSFSAEVNLAAGVNSVTFYGDTVDWLEFTPNYTEGKIRITAKHASSIASSKRYSVIYRSFGGDVSGVVSNIVIDYVALPEILSPIAATFSSQSPLRLSRKLNYTDTSPILQISADNMLSLSSDFPSDVFEYTSSSLPDGLVLDATTGKLTGQLTDPEILGGHNFTLTVSASNPAGAAVNPQLIYFLVVADDRPSLSFANPPENNVFALDNITIYGDVIQPFTLTTTGGPITHFSLYGDIPAGLTFNTSTGRILGKILATSSGSRDLQITASNVYGTSNSLSFTLDYTIYKSPEIVSPTSHTSLVLSAVDESTTVTPTLTVVATQVYGGTDNYAVGLVDAVRNHFSSTSLPPGFQIGLYTGKIYGKLTPGTIPTDSVKAKNYACEVLVSNPIGVSSLYINFSFFNAGLRPVINNLISGQVISLSRNRVYSSSDPLYRVAAINSPTSFDVVGLPAGLAINATGALIGMVDTSAYGGDYSLTVTAINATGISDEVHIQLRIPVNILSPVDGGSIVLTVNQAISSSVEILTCQFNDFTTATITTSTLPAGLSLSGTSITGTPSALGTSFVKLYATTENYGTAQITVQVKVVDVSYSISGNVSVLGGAPVAGVLITDGNTSATTRDDGSYTLNNCVVGSYNITASKPKHILTPRYRPVTVTSANLYNVNFTIEGPLRTVFGSVLNTDNLPVFGVLISEGSHTTKTDSFGQYALSVSRVGAAPITASLPYSIAIPASIALDDGVVDLFDQNFVVAIASPPKAPTLNSITLEDRKFVVNFTPPADDGGYAITNYLYNLNNTGYRSANPITTASPVEISGLTPGTTYTVSLRAFSQIGSGADSNSLTATAVGAASAPTINLITSSGPTSLRVQFTSPANDGGYAVVGYRYRLDSGDFVDVSDLAENSFTISGLSGGVRYSVILAAVTSVGIGDSSAPYAGVPLDVPHAPTIASITSASGQLFVNLVPPANNGGSPIINYRYTLNGGEGFIATRDNSSIVSIVGLMDGVSYSVTVAAVNAQGAGPFSASVAAVPQQSPYAPILTSIDAGDTTLVVNFTPPVLGASSVVSYSYSLDDGSTYQECIPPGTLSPVRIYGLTNGTSYAVRLRPTYSDLTYGATSNTLSSIPFTFPSAPTIDSIRPNNNALVVSYTAGDIIGGLPLTNYQYSLDAGTTWISRSPASTLSPLTISNLLNGTSYDVQLRALNSEGRGAASATTTATPYTLPAAPVLNSVLISSNAFVVEAIAPNNGGAAITNYAYSLDNGFNFIVFAPAVSAPPFTLPIADALVGTACRIRLRAINVLGQGPSSNTLTATFITVPAAPTISVIAPGNELAVVNFVPRSTGGSTITDYEYSIDNSPFISGDKTTSPIIINDLVNGRLYSIRVRATNIKGAGFASQAVSVTPRKAPDAPHIAAVTPGDSSLSITFTAPNDNGSPITKYAYSINNGATYTELPPESVNSPIVRSSLINGKNYTVKVKAYNEAGFGTPSTGYIVAPAGPAYAPSLTTLIPGNGSLTLAFNAPTNNGGSAVVGYQYSLNGDPFIASARLANSITIPGLVNGRSYSVTLRAITSYGPGATSLALSAIPRTTPDAPVITELLDFSRGLGSTEYNIPVGSKAFVIKFTAPADGGSPITNYKYTLDAAATEFNPAKTTDAPFVILDSSIAEGFPYSVTIFARNSLGYGPVSNTVTYTPGTPSAPAITSIVAENNQLKIYFTPPVSDGGSSILTYSYKLTPEQYPQRIYPFNTTSPITLNIGDAFFFLGTTFNISIAATNNLGFGKFSNVVAATAGLPGAVRIDNVDALTDGLKIYFTPPADNGNAAVINHEYSINSSSYILLDPPQAAIPGVFTITGLVKNTVYSISLRARNSVGVGKETTITATPGAASPPTLTYVTAAGSGKLIINFIPPITDGGSKIVNYQYSLDGGAYVSVSPPDVTNYITITGLTNGTNYAIRLRAVNEYGGFGIASTPIAGIPIASPSSPIIASVESITAFSIAINFTPPTDTGGTAITNYEYSLDGGNTFTSYESITSPIVVTGLDICSEIDVVLQATNIVGTGPNSNTVHVFAGRFLAPRLLDIYTIYEPTGAGVPDSIFIWENPPYNGLDVTLDRNQLDYSIDGGVNWLAYGNYYGGTLIQNSNFQPAPEGSDVLIRLSYSNYPVGLCPGLPSISGVYYKIGTPNSPTINSVVVSNEALTVNFSFNLKYSWEEPTPVTDVAYSLNGVDYVSSGTVTGPITISGLTNLVTYNITLRGVNAQGVGRPSQTTSAILLPAPTVVSVTSPSVSSLIVNFTAPIDPNGVITNYEYSTDGGSTWVLAGKITSPITITELTLGTSYDVCLRALALHGTSLPSIITQAIPGSPSAPVLLSVDNVGDLGLFLNFTPPVSFGPLPLAYYEYEIEDLGTYTDTATAKADYWGRTHDGQYLTSGRYYYGGYYVFGLDGYNYVVDAYVNSGTPIDIARADYWGLTHDGQFESSDRWYCGGIYVGNSNDYLTSSCG